MTLIKKSLVISALYFALPLWADTSGSEPKSRPKLTIYEYQITGNTLLDPRDLERVLEPFLGENQVVTAVEKAAKKIERLYKDKGYPTVYVNIPEQDIRQGIIKMSIVEGKVQRLRITGAHYYTLSGIRNELPAVQEGQTPYFPDVQQQLSKINARSQHLKVTPVLKPGKFPGSVDIELKVKDELPWVNQLSVSNYNSANTTRPRLEFNTAYNNLWQKDHGLSLQYQTSPEKTEEVSIWGFTYLMPVLKEHRAAVYMVKSDSQVASLGGQTAFTALGKGDIYGLRYIIPLESHSDFLHSITLDFDYKDFTDTLEIAGNKEKGQADLRQDLAPIAYGLFGFDYDMTFMRAKGSDRFGVGGRWGMRGLNDDKEFEAKRKKSEPNFSYATLSARLMREVMKGWQVRLNTKTQLTDSLLIGNEQFSIGGNETVRGYFQSETLGDTGIYSQLELRTPVLMKSVSWLKDWRVLAFVDAGEVKVKSPIPEQISRTTLASVGLGTRLKITSQLSLAVDAAKTLHEGAKTPEDHWRMDAQVRWQF
ncbi:MAG TPA: ShlB/FhaC/HecB family hemolysin secretion/activation protein [Cellvibrionaceae bacterium]|nr:ShlB/FhaC/HecB family hemolysin secretion/activation protein [Cellvibrionaceae bacterium]